MTIRFDETLCDIVITDDKGSATQLRVPFAGKQRVDLDAAYLEERNKAIGAVCGAFKVASKQPSEPRYVVTYMGQALFRSNRIMGARVKEMIASGYRPDRIQVFDTVEHKVYGIERY